MPAARQNQSITFVFNRGKNAFTISVDFKHINIGICFARFGKLFGHRICTARIVMFFNNLFVFDDVNFCAFSAPNQNGNAPRKVIIYCALDRKFRFLFRRGDNKFYTRSFFKGF